MLSTTLKRRKFVTRQTQRLSNILTQHIQNFLLRLVMLGLVCVQTDSTLLEAQETVFIVTSDSNTLQSPSVDVHEDTIHVLDSHCVRA